MRAWKCKFLFVLDSTLLPQKMIFLRLKKVNFMPIQFNLSAYICSKMQIIWVTHPKTGDLREALKYIYSIYVEYVVKNPLYTPGTPIR